MEKNNWWENILNTGLGIAQSQFGGVKTPPPAAAPAQAPGMSQKTMLLIGGAVVAVFVLIFALKK